MLLRVGRVRALAVGQRLGGASEAHGQLLRDTGPHAATGTW